MQTELRAEGPEAEDRRSVQRGPRRIIKLRLRIESLITEPHIQTRLRCIDKIKRDGIAVP